MAKDVVKPGSYFGGQIPKSLAIIKCHQDEVFELLESATLLAYSEKCNVKMCSFGNHFLCIQGHPEYNKEILFEIIDRVINMKLMEEEDFADKAKATMEDTEPDWELWQIAKTF